MLQFNKNDTVDLNSRSNCSSKTVKANSLILFTQTQRMKRISSEQKRRFNIRIGCSTLNSLVSVNSKSVSNLAALMV